MPTFSFSIFTSLLSPCLIYSAFLSIFQAAISFFLLVNAIVSQAYSELRVSLSFEGSISIQITFLSFPWFNQVLFIALTSSSFLVSIFLIPISRSFVIFLFWLPPLSRHWISAANSLIELLISQLLLSAIEAYFLVLCSNF